MHCWSQEMKSLPDLSRRLTNCLNLAYIDFISVEGGLRDSWGRDEKHLSLSASPVFKGVLGRRGRDGGNYISGCYVKNALITALIWRKMSNFAKNTIHNERSLQNYAYLCRVIISLINKLWKRLKEPAKKSVQHSRISCAEKKSVRYKQEWSWKQWVNEDSSITNCQVL